MQCAKCNKDLRHCECKDLGERIEKLFESRFLFFTEEQKRVLREQAERNKEQQITE